MTIKIKTERVRIWCSDLARDKHQRIVSESDWRLLGQHNAIFARLPITSAVGHGPIFQINDVDINVVTHELELRRDAYSSSLSAWRLFISPGSTLPPAHTHFSISSLAACRSPALIFLSSVDPASRVTPRLYAKSASATHWL